MLPESRLIKGPFTVVWNDALIDVSELTFNYDVATNDYETIDGRTFQVQGAITASVEITLLSTDVDVLAALLPQYYVPQGGTLSTGESVVGEKGAIDIKAASCDTSETYHNLDIISCAGDTMRLVRARAALTSTEIADNSVRTVTITFTGEPEQGMGTIQIFGKDAIEEES